MLNGRPRTGRAQIRVHSDTSFIKKGSKVKQKPPRQTVTFEQLSYSNKLTLNALVQLLTEKGVLTKPEILERIKKLQSETKVSPQ